MTAFLADSVGASVTSTYSRLHLLRLTLQQLLGRLLQFALIREIGYVGRVLSDQTDLAGHFALIAGKCGLPFSLAERFQLLSALLEGIVARRAVR